MARTGRRKGATDTREGILAAARDAFASKGYDGASIRAIATAAGVDPALVHHYFGTKEKLFLATVDAPVNPAEFMPAALAGDVDHLGERVVRMFLSVWDDPRTGPPLLALVRSSLAHDWSARILREFVTAQILRRVVARLEVDPAEAPIRAALTASQMIGLGLTRYLLKIEPLASADKEEVVTLVAPTVQRYLTGPLKVLI
ncbi:MAG TPA: TetR family transcriptional regulator [Micromonosporaceae bacterium]